METKNKKQNCLVCMKKKEFGTFVSCAKRSGSGGRGRRALSWQATEAFSWANLEGRHEKSTALHESRPTENHFCAHCTTRYTTSSANKHPLTLHKQECKCVRTGKGRCVHPSSVIRRQRLTLKGRKQGSKGKIRFGLLELGSHLSSFSKSGFFWGETEFKSHEQSCVAQENSIVSAMLLLLMELWT